MEENLSPRRMFMQKREETHSNEEITEAFENAFSVSFALAKNRSPIARSRLFGQLWAANPDAIITQLNFVSFTGTAMADPEQYLVINRNTDRAGHDKMMQLLKDSGVVPHTWCYLPGRFQGIRCCYRRNLENDRCTHTHKAALLQDDDHLVLTIRNLSKTDRELLFPQNK